MSANPYAAQLGNLDALQVIADSPRRLTALIERLGPEGMEMSLAPGKWRVREIVCHLTDTEVAFSFRLRQALAEPHHTVQPFDQDAWAKSYAALPARAAMETFSALRRWNMALLETVPPEGFAKTLTHPERGDMTFHILVETMAGHDLNHLRQLETIASKV
jgi:hypothetical protein